MLAGICAMEQLVGGEAEQQEFLSSGGALKCGSSWCYTDSCPNRAKQPGPDAQVQGGSQSRSDRVLGGSWGGLSLVLQVPAFTPANLTPG